MSVHSLMFGWEYPPAHLGGLGVACQGLVRGLLHHGAKVTLVLPQGDAEMDPGLEVVSPSEQLIQTVRVRAMLQPYDSFASFADRKQKQANSRIGITLYGRDLGEAVHTFTELSVELTKNVTANIVHSHDWMTFGAGKRAATYHRIPFVAHVHATELDRTHFRPNEWIYWREREGLEAADHIITVSNYTKQILVREYGIRADKIDVVHNGTHDSPQFGDVMSSRHDRHPMVLFLGRLTVQKGPFHFLEAARIVHHHRPDTQFVMAGEGYLLPELVERACAMGLDRSILFAGKVNGTEARELYKHASCFVMPSTSEPFGLVALEAIAAGAPVILSKQSGVSEVVSHAFHVDFWDIDKLADCIVTVLREEPLALQLRSEASHTLQRLRWENQAGKVLSIYDKVRMLT